MAIDLGEIEKELEEEIRELELEKAGYEARLDEKAPPPLKAASWRCRAAVCPRSRGARPIFRRRKQRQGEHYGPGQAPLRNCRTSVQERRSAIGPLRRPPLLLSQTPKEGGRGGAGDPSVDEAQSESGRYSRRGALRRLPDGSGHSRKPHLARRLRPSRWIEASQATRRPWQIPPPGTPPPSSRLCGQS